MPESLSALSAEIFLRSEISQDMDRLLKAVLPDQIPELFFSQCLHIHKLDGVKMLT